MTKALYMLEHWIYKKADAVIFTMEGGKQYIIDQGWEKDVPLDKIYYINNGVDLEVYHRQEQENIFHDPELEQGDTFKVMYTGSMGQANSMFDILDAAEKLKDRADIRFLLFGAGYLEDDLKKYARKKHLENVSFKGKVDKKYIWR